MSLFNRTRVNVETKKRLYVGSPEAEAESTKQSRVYLGEVFEDFLGVYEDLESEKFIVTGKKGTGKTAIAEYFHYISQSEPNSFTSFIKKSDFNLHAIIENVDSVNGNFQEALLFDWVISIKLVDLIMKNEAIYNHPDYEQLRRFIDRNSGYVKISDYAILEEIKNNSGEINISGLKRFFQTRFKKSIGIKSERAPFYRILPRLKEVIISVLKDEVDDGYNNEYILFIDDLDTGFSLNSKDSLSSILKLLRIARDYNINELGKNGLNAKIVLLLRDDISSGIIGEDADTAKIIYSYSIPLSWYDNETRAGNGSHVLKQFINKRLDLALTRASYKFDVSNPWNSLVPRTHKYGKDTFSFVLDHSLLRPRDLILFFGPLSGGVPNYPLNYDDVLDLIYSMSKGIVQDIKNELLVIYSKHEVDILFDCLGKVPNIYDVINYRDIHSMVINSGFESPDKVMSDLYNYGIVGNITWSDDKAYTYFYHKKRPDEEQKIDPDMGIIYSKFMRAYFAGKSYSPNR